MKASAIALLAAASLIAVQAHAAVQTYEFKGTTSQGAFDAVVSLDVQNGFAVSGSGTISGAALGTNSPLQLVTYDTDGAIHDSNGNFGLQSNHGDNLDQYDDAVPLTSTGGVLFALGAGAPSKGSGLLIGFYALDSAVGGQIYGDSPTGFRFYEDTTGGSVTAVAASAAPEPGAWALMMAGVGLLGLALRSAKTRRRQAGLAVAAA